MLARSASIAALLLFALTSSAEAQNVPEMATPTPVDADRAAVAAIVMESVSDVKRCGLATEKSNDPEVRLLCRKGSAESARTAIAGMQLAQTLGGPAAKLQPSPGTSAELDTLAQYSGQDFDREFLLAEIRDRSGEELDVRYAVEVANDKSVKSYEDGVLPKLADQLERAEGALRRISEASP